MNRPMIKSIKDIVEYLKPLFNKRSYSNFKFHQGIIIAILLVVVCWLGSSIYFANRVFNFVTERISSHSEKVDSAISEGRDHIGYVGKKMKEFWDEKHVTEALAAEWEQEANLKRIEARKQELEDFNNWLQNASYQEVSNQVHKVDKAARYLRDCNVNLDTWVRGREEKVLTKQRLAKKYEQDIAEERYWDSGEKRAMEEYIKEAANLDPNYSREYLLKILKDRQPSEVKIKGEAWNFDEMHACLQMADSTIAILYYNFYNSNKSSVDGDYKFFPYLKYLATSFQINHLDFTIPFVLTQETDALSQMVSFPKDQNIFETMKRELKYQNVVFPEYASKAMAIFEATNHKLAQINPDNMGFNTKAYKYRMEQYAFWKQKEAEAKVQEAAVQKQKAATDIKLAEQKLKQITQARKAEEKTLNRFKNDYPVHIAIVENYEKKVKALLKKEKEASAQLSLLKKQSEIVSSVSKENNQPEGQGE